MFFSFVYLRQFWCSLFRFFLFCSHLNLLNHIAADAPPTTSPTKTKILEDWKIITAAVLGVIIILVFIGAVAYCCCWKRRSKRRRDGKISLFRYDSSYSVIPSKLLNNLLISWSSTYRQTNTKREHKRKTLFKNFFFFSLCTSTVLKWTSFFTF